MLFWASGPRGHRVSKELKTLDIDIDALCGWVETFIQDGINADVMIRN